MASFIANNSRSIAGAFSPQESIPMDHRSPRHLPLNAPDQQDDGLLTQDHFVDEAETFHISFWLCSPWVEPQSLDIAVSFPQTVERLSDTATESRHSWLTEVVPVRPQLDEDYGSMVMIPSWVVYSVLWIQWTAVRNGLFYAGAFIASLQLEVVEGHVVVVRGGRRRGRSGVIRLLTTARCLRSSSRRPLPLRRLRHQPPAPTVMKTMEKTMKALTATTCRTRQISLRVSPHRVKDH